MQTCLPDWATRCRCPDGIYVACGFAGWARCVVLVLATVVVWMVGIVVAMGPVWMVWPVLCLPQRGVLAVLGSGGGLLVPYQRRQVCCQVLEARPECGRIETSPCCVTQSAFLVSGTPVLPRFPCRLISGRSTRCSGLFSTRSQSFFQWTVAGLPYACLTRVPEPLLPPLYGRECVWAHRSGVIGSGMDMNKLHTASSAYGTMV